MKIIKDNPVNYSDTVVNEICFTREYKNIKITYFENKRISSEKMQKYKTLSKLKGLTVYNNLHQIKACDIACLNVSGELMPYAVGIMTNKDYKMFQFQILYIVQIVTI